MVQLVILVYMKKKRKESTLWMGGEGFILSQAKIFM